jgi:hypothetical protein
VPIQKNRASFINELISDSSEHCASRWQICCIRMQS